MSGDGVFAQESIAQGTVILPLTGDLVDRADLGDDSYDRAILQIEDDLFLEAAGGPDDYINHSCAPNLAFTDDGKAYYALRTINVGEELTFDYATSEDDADWRVDCLCKSANCRGFITGFPALAPADQMRLYPFCLPYLKRKYAGLLKKTA